ncbi:hypothetical protein ACIHCX_28975 [Streptomyces sp. NPDC052043]|uniref:hypothetical protein n=1 Tax=Streptomyces sp. NPDC052043 TaxID=3365684 RepID=UPI0037D188C7
MKIRRWAGRGVSVLVVGGVLVLVTGCSGVAGKPGVTREAQPAVVTVPKAKPDAMRATKSAALQYTSFTAEESFSGGCASEHQCKAALMGLQSVASPVAEQLHDEAGWDPYYADLSDLADRVSEGVQKADPADPAAMDALLKDVMKLRERLDHEMDIGHF